MLVKFAITNPCVNGVEIVRTSTAKGHPFTYHNVCFRYKGRFFEASFKSTIGNIHDAEDMDSVVSVFNPETGNWSSIVLKHYVDSIADTKFTGKEVTEEVINYYFDCCFIAVKELYETSAENK